MKLRIGILVLANLLGFGMIAYFLDYLGVWDGYSRLVGAVGSTTHLALSRQEDLSLLEREEQKKLLESFTIREAALEEKTSDLAQREEALSREMEALVEERQKLTDRQARMEQAEAEVKSYQQKVSDLAAKLAQMPPAKATERILALGDDLLALDVLDAMDAYYLNIGQNTVVPYLMSLMPKEDASRLLRKKTVTE